MFETRGPRRRAPGMGRPALELVRFRSGSVARIVSTMSGGASKRFSKGMRSSAKAMAGVGSRIQGLRLRLQRSEHGFASLLGVTQETIVEWECGRKVDRAVLVRNRGYDRYGDGMADRRVGPREGRCDPRRRSRATSAGRRPRRREPTSAGWRAALMPLLRKGEEAGADRALQGGRPKCLRHEFFSLLRFSTAARPRT